MNTARRIAKNTTVLFIATIVSYTLAFFTTIYTARYLGVEGFGVISLALALTGIFNIFTDLGISTLTVREIARDKSLTNKYTFNTSIMKVFLSILTFVLIAITVNIIGYPQQVALVVYLITLSVILASFSGVFNSMFQAYEKMEYISIGTILNSAIIFLGVLIAVYYQMDILIFAALYFIASAVVLLYSFSIYTLKFFSIKSDLDWSFWKPTIKNALPFGITGIFVNVYYWISSVMLSVMVGNEAVGYYNAAYRLIFVFLALFSVYMTSIFPVMSSFYKTSQESLKFSYELSFKYLLMISIPIAVGTTLLADKIILLVYGNGYIPAIIVLQILIWTLVFMFVNSLSGYLLGSINKQMIVTKVAAIAAVVNIVANILLIPKFSYVGSSVATVITEFTLLPFLIYALLKTDYADKKSLVRYLPKIIFCNLIMAIFIIYLRSLNLFILVILATILYFGALYLTRTLDERDISILRSIIKK